MKPSIKLIIPSFLAAIAVLLISSPSMGGAGSRVGEVFTYAPPGIGTAAHDGSLCLKCHKDVYSSMLTYTVKHEFGKNGCKVCHIKKESSHVSNIPVNTDSKENLLFLDVKASSPYVLRVKAMDGEGNEAVSPEIAFIPSEIYRDMTDDNTAPMIRNLHVEEVKEGVFHSATISWETDEPSTSQVEYGVSKRGFGDHTLLNDDILTKQHRVEVGGLVRGKTYYLRAISKDIYGNTSVSESMKVKVKGPFSTRKAEPEPDIELYIEDVYLLKIGDRTAVSWRTSKSANGVVLLSKDTKMEAALSAEPHYPGLSMDRYAGLDSCINGDCHDSGSSRLASHPSGAVSWYGLLRPDDLPLAKNSMILCTTCHTPHGGFYSRILRKNKNELCSSCHVN